MKSLIAILFLVLLSACGLEIEDNGTDAQYLLKREKLIQDYSVVIGDYEGSIFNSNTGVKIPIRLSLFLDEVENGKDSYGRPRMLPFLRAFYNRLDYDYDYGDLTFTADYNPETGSLLLGSPISPGTGPAKLIFSFTGSVNNKNIEGDFFDEKGYFGTLKAKILKSKR